MKLSAARIRELIDRQNIKESNLKPLIEPFDEERIKYIEGSKYNLTVGLFLLPNPPKILSPHQVHGYLGRVKRQTPQWIEKKQDVVLLPLSYICVQTIETINMPNFLCGEIKPRSTLQRQGLLLLHTGIDPGFSGQLTFGLVNLGPFNIRVEIGAQIAAMMVEELTQGSTDPYKGIWKGDKHSTDGVERAE